MEVRSAVILCWSLLWPVIRADYTAHSDSNEDKDDTIALTLLIVFGVVFAVQILVFLLFACKGYDVVFGSRSSRGGSDSQLLGEFPFLPSYDMAVSDTRAHPQLTGSSTPNTNIDNGVIVDICRLSATPALENQGYASEASVSVVNTPPNNERIDSGIIVEMDSLSAAPLLRDQRVGTNCSNLNTSPSYGSIESDVTVDINRQRVTSAIESQRDSLETNVCGVNTPSSLAF